MGRGEGVEYQLGSEAGEISAQDADRLDDHHSVGIEMGLSEDEYGDPDDSRAIRRLISRLSKTHAASKLSEQGIEDQAIAMYQKMITKMENGCPRSDQEKIAGLLGEPLDELRERLGLDAEPDPPADEALLSQLRSMI